MRCYRNFDLERDRGEVLEPDYPTNKLQNALRLQSKYGLGHTVLWGPILGPILSENRSRILRIENRPELVFLLQRRNSDSRNLPPGAKIDIRIDVRISA
jgi:hypothetical protein